MHIGKRFHFQAFWPKVEGFAEVVVQAWNSGLPNPNPFKGFDDKLRAMKKCQARWSDKFIGNVKLQSFLAHEVILRLDVEMETSHFLLTGYAL